MKRLAASILTGLVVLAVAPSDSTVVQTTRTDAADGPPVVSNAPDGSLFGPTLFESPPVDAADQRRMLQDMLWRFDAADPLLLGVADAARDRARLLLLLRRLASGQSIPADLFATMVRQFDQREQVVMERLARRYRLHVSGVFRREVQRRADRLEAWDDVLESWRRAGSPRTQRHKLTTWLLAGIENSTPGTIETLPAPPRFTFVPDLSSSSVARPVAASADRPPTAPAARPARMAIGPRLAPSAFLVANRRTAGLATLPDRRARPTPYGGAWREAPRVERVWPPPYRRREGDRLALDQPHVDQRQVVSRPHPTAGRALPDRQAGRPMVSVYTPYSGLPRRAIRASLPARRWAESPWAAFAATVDRLATPVFHACPPVVDDWSEPLVEPRTPPGQVAPELLAGNTAASRQPRAAAAKAVHFARFTARSETDSARPIARRRAGVGRNGIPSVYSGANGRITNPSYDRYSLGAPDAEERSIIPKAPSTERARAVVATAAVPARQQRELEINVPRRPLAWRRSEAAPAATPARRRESSRSAEFASRPHARDHLAGRAAARGNMAGGLDLTSFAARSSGPTSGSRVVLNRDEVAARIAGVNLALRAMAAELDQRRAWDATRLALVVERLRELCVRHGDLTLYLQLMEEHERDLVGRLKSPRSIVTRLGTRIHEARRGALGGEFRGGAHAREVELAALDVLSLWLVKLTIE